MKKSDQRYILVFVAFFFLLSACASPTTITRSPTVPVPTNAPFALPTGDFVLSWDIYNSMYNSTGGILTLRKQGTTYTETIVYPDGSCGTIELSIISEGEEISLTDRPGNPFGDKMVITGDGYLNYFDGQGFIYGVPPIQNQTGIVTECLQPTSEQGQEINVALSVDSVEPLGGNQVRITLSTNLPDGMNLMVDLKGSGGYWAQDDPQVAGGVLVTDFGNVVAGNYELTITSPVVSVQPEKIKPLLGEKGENLVGDLVSYDASWGSYFLEFKSLFTID